MGTAALSGAVGLLAAYPARSGAQGRPVRGGRIYLALDTDNDQVITQPVQ